MALVKQASVTAWYTTQSTGAHDFAKEAYEDAVKYFEQHLTRDNEKRDWIRAQNTVDDVLAAVERARTLYEGDGDSNVHRSICALASRVQYYGGVLDVFAQHHPEYVALAWGAIKFIFIGVINHEELVTEISRALTSIADVLPHVRLGIDLYPTTYMKEAVSRVYAHIMLFLEKATKWYTMSPARRAWSALAKPYSIGYKDTVNQIRSCTESIHLIASAAARAEIRDQTVILEEHKVILRELDKMLRETKDRTQSIFNIADASQNNFDQILQVSEGTQKIAGATLVGVTEQGVRIQDIQLSGILDAIKPTRMPEDVLCACVNVAKRRQLWRTPTPDSDRFLQTLNSWIKAPTSSLFVLQACLRAEARAKDLALQAANFLRESQQTVFWYFSERLNEDIDLTLSTIIKSLIFQILVRYPGIVQSEPQFLSIVSFKSQHTHHEWLDLLAVLLRQIERCFLIIEMEDLLERLKDGSQAHKGMLQTFGDFVNKLQTDDPRVKILLVYSGRADMSDSGNTAGVKSGFSMQIRQPIVGPVKRNLKRRSATLRTGRFHG